MTSNISIATDGATAAIPPRIGHQTASVAITYSACTHTSVPRYREQPSACSLCLGVSVTRARTSVAENSPEVAEILARTPASPKSLANFGPADTDDDTIEVAVEPVAVDRTPALLDEPDAPEVEAPTGELALKPAALYLGVDRHVLQNYAHITPRVVRHPRSERTYRHYQVADLDAHRDRIVRSAS